MNMKKGTVKRILLAVLIIITLVLLVYSFIAKFEVSGAGAYRISTEKGRLFANTWQYTLIAAFLLIAVLLVISIIKIRKSKVKIINQKIEPTKPLTDTSSQGLIKPKSGSMKSKDEDENESVNLNSQNEEKCYCQNCGAQVSKEDIYCGECGFKISDI